MVTRGSGLDHVAVPLHHPEGQDVVAGDALPAGDEAITSPEQQPAGTNYVCDMKGLRVTRVLTDGLDGGEE